MSLIKLTPRPADVNSGSFAKEYMARTLTFLHSTYNLTMDDCQDVFQDAYIVLLRNANDGKLSNLSSSLYTYFLGICRNKVMELNRSKDRKMISITEEEAKDGHNNSIDVNKASRLLGIIEEGNTMQNAIQDEVCNIVDDLPSPCNEILWSFYRDSLSMDEIARMFGYTSAGVAKVTKHRCMEKFRKRCITIFRNI